MAAPGMSDVTYMGRPKWSVAHHLGVSGVPSPSKTAPFHHLSIVHHRRNIIAASVAIGLLIAAFCFSLMQARHTAQNLQNTTKSWASAAINARGQTPMSDNTQTPTHQVTQPQSPASTPPSSPSATNNNTTSVTVNGESVPVPANGTIHREYTSGNSRSTVDITVHQRTGP